MDHHQFSKVHDRTTWSIFHLKVLDGIHMNKKRRKNKQITNLTLWTSIDTARGVSCHPIRWQPEIIILPSPTLSKILSMVATGWVGMDAHYYMVAVKGQNQHHHHHHHHHRHRHRHRHHHRHRHRYRHHDLTHPKVFPVLPAKPPSGCSSPPNFPRLPPMDLKASQASKQRLSQSLQSTCLWIFQAK